MSIIEGDLPPLSKFVYNYNLEGPTTDLNTVDVWSYGTSPQGSARRKIWLIYIHGGGWRDPEVDSTAFEPAMKSLWASHGDSRIAGFVSINYRLSPHPFHQRLPSNSSDDSRNVVYPAHIRDVEDALKYLEKAYKISDGYILAGHSAGATLAFQAKAVGLPKPLAILGIAGIYDINLLLMNHKDEPIYEKFITGAFPNQAEWKDASPALTQSTGLLWETAKLVIISHSKTDGLVEDTQADLMYEKVKSQTGESNAVHFLEAQGQHDAMWEQGTVLAELITKSLELLDTVP